MRIISLAPHTTELAYEAGLGSNLIAVSAHSDYPPAAQKLEQVANFKGINLERILALKPDLILAWRGGNPEKPLKLLEKLGIPIFYSNPNSLQDIVNDIEKLGAFSDDPQAIQSHVSALKEQIISLTNNNKNKQKVKYFYQLSSTPLMTHNADNWPEPLFSLCGGENVFAKSPNPYPQVSPEQVIVKQPEAIFLSANAQNINWQQWEASIPAVKNKAVFNIDDIGLARPTPRAFTTINLICQYINQVSQTKG